MIFVGILIGIVAPFALSFIAGLAFAVTIGNASKVNECHEDLYATLGEIEWTLYKMAHPEIYDQD